MLEKTNRIVYRTAFAADEFTPLLRLKCLRPGWFNASGCEDGEMRDAAPLVV
jgi:hypothetical protein